MSDTPEADALDQSRTVEEATPPEAPDRDLEVPEADALEQAQPIPEAEERDR